jgi:molybdate/tungstate transport system substrate-binding protein
MRLSAARIVYQLMTASMLAASALGCSRNTDATPRSAAASARPAVATGVRLYNAASIARPLRALADSFTARTGIAVVQESQSSLELARRLTEFSEIPDVIALADWRVFPTLLAPKFVDGWWLFARNRLVIAYTDQSRHREALANDGWRHVLTQPDVETGRADANTDPSGYRALMAFQLAELHYGEPGLAHRLLAAAPARNVRPREADQVGMLQAGALDYIWTYESLARGAGLAFVTLPPDIDLGHAADSLTYAKASVRVAGKQRGDSVTFRGEPILYGVAIPIAAPDAAVAHRFVQFMLGDDGRRIMRAAALDALDAPIPAGKAAAP